MNLTAIFESWHIGDGNYPPLHRDELVRLSFELQPDQLEILPDPAALSLQHAGNAQYTGCGRVLRRYGEGDGAIAVIEALGLRFYVHGSHARCLAPGHTVEFTGSLLLDHYMWVEFLDRYPDPPDLFYNLRVNRIRKVRIPERFVGRGPNKALSYPTRVHPRVFGHVEELDSMEGQDFTLEFYILDFSSDGLEGLSVPRTFQ